MHVSSRNKKIVTKSDGKLSGCLKAALWLGLRYTAAAVVAACMLPVTLHAQTGQGSIGGTVHDLHGGLVPHARVEVISDSTGIRQQTVTNDEGSFQVPSLNPGTYTVNVAAEGFEQKTTK